MKALLNQDIVIRISETHGDTEIGDIPAGKKGRIGFDRLRFTGKKLVDLMDLKYIWVKHLGNNFFELHAVKVPDSKRITMSYSDRARLVFEGNTIRVKTLEEAEQAEKKNKVQMAKNKLRSRFKDQIGDQGDQTATIAKLVYLLVMALDNNTEAIALLHELMADVEHTYPMDKLAKELPDLIEKTKDLMIDYRNEVLTI